MLREKKKIKEMIQDNPRVCLNISPVPLKDVPLWVLIERMRPRVSLVRVMGIVGLQGVTKLMAIMEH